MAIENDAVSAFPSQAGFDYKGQRVTNTSEGMTLRDYFAAKAMQGILSDPDVKHDDEHGDFHAFSRAIAGQSYAIADAMLEARKS